MSSEKLLGGQAREAAKALHALLSLLCRPGLAISVREIRTKKQFMVCSIKGIEPGCGGIRVVEFKRVAGV